MLIRVRMECAAGLEGTQEIPPESYGRRSLLPVSDNGEGRDPFRGLPRRGFQVEIAIAVVQARRAMISSLRMTERHPRLRSLV